MKDVKVIIPSFRRANVITAHKMFDDYTVCIPEDDFADYRAAGIAEENLVCHPSDLVGMARKRNWIFDNLQGDDTIMMLDDDLERFNRLYPGTGEKLVVDDGPAYIQGVLNHTAQLAEDLGVYYFGFANTPDTRIYATTKPFSLTGFLNGWSIGFRPNHGIRCDEHLVAKAEYDIALKNAFLHRKCLRNSRYAFKSRDTFHLEGGLSTYRTRETEEQDVLRLKRSWGDLIGVAEGSGWGPRRQMATGYSKMRLRLPY